ncbi:MAG TPA: peptidylprolyl isomerase [Candidatus Bathyarchaeia archaeon]
MPKLKSSARRSRRNKRIGIAVSVIAIVAVAAVLVYVYGRPGPVSPPIVQGKVLLHTSMGNITIELRDDKPVTSSNFRSLVEQGKYDGTVFHRIIDGFMIQGGQLNETVATIVDEIGINNRNVRGTIAMAKTSQPNSATSGFFINVVDNGNNPIDEVGTKFDTVYTVFGTVIEGMNVVDDISKVPVELNEFGENSKPLQNVTLISAKMLP